MAHDARAGGAVPILGGQDLRRLLPAGEGPVEVVEHCRLPSAHFTLETLLTLQQRVQELACRPDVKGIVITHGTDTLL